MPPGVTEVDPVLETAPDQAPEAVQDVAFVTFHESVVEARRAIDGGDALKLTTGGSTTDTVTDLASWPIGPVQVRV